MKNRSQQNIFIEEMKIIPKLKYKMKLLPQTTGNTTADIRVQGKDKA